MFKQTILVFFIAVCRIASLPQRKIRRIQTKKQEKSSNMMIIAALSILAGFANVVTSIRTMTLDERIDWGNSSDFKGTVQLLTCS